MARRDGRASAEARQQRDAAAKALERGRYEAALQAYLALERLEPDDPDWPKRAADCCRRLGRPSAELAALERAAAGYARGGFTVKAIAVCKRILGLDPGHRETQRKLTELHSDRVLGLDRVAVRGGFAAAFEGRGLAPVPEATSPAAVPSAAPSPEPATAAPPTDSAEAGAHASDRALPADAAPMPRPASVPPARALSAVGLSAIAPSRRSLSLRPAPAPVYELDLGDELPEPPVTAEDVPSPPASRESPAPPPASASSAPAAGEYPGASPPGVGDGSDPGVVAAAARAYTPLFSEVSAESFAHLVDRLQLLELDAGTRVFREGDPPDALYVVAEGQLEVVAEGPPRERVGLLGDGDFFGEIGLLSDVPRQRTVEALEDSRLLVLDRQLVSELVDRDPAFLRVLLRFLRERLVAMLFRSSELLAPFGPREREEIVSRFRFLELAAGTTLIEPGRRADGLFVLLSGGAEVVSIDGERVLAALGTGDVFGEMSLLSGSLPVARVRTTQRTYSLLMPARDFTETVMTHPHVLAYTSALAERRLQSNAAVGEDAEPFAERHLELV